MTEQEEILIRDLGKLSPERTLTDTQLEQLRIFEENLIEWNRVMNLTAITEPDQIYGKHFLDSMTMVRIEQEAGIPKTPDKKKPFRIIDVGTGAGFPGLVLAILYPDLSVTLMDSLNKRISFLTDTAEKAKITNVTCIHARAEELARNKEHREQYDLAVSRAVANLSTLSEYCLPFVKVGGTFVAYKSEKIEEELPAGEKALKILGGKIAKKDDFTITEGGEEVRRSLVLVKKEKQTPKAYPRKAGTPAKEPLGTK